MCLGEGGGRPVSYPSPSWPSPAADRCPGKTSTGPKRSAVMPSQPAADSALLPENGIATITYGGLCRGLQTGKMREDTYFTGDDLRKNDSKFQGERYRQCLDAMAELDRFARERYGKSVLALALRWLVDHSEVTTALWGGLQAGAARSRERNRGLVAGSAGVQGHG
ncbi:aldo/keto reductase [Halomonas sp.]|uniref:aldo/keto reductase n=1 Tax=Halomonas sp. TaxID=1486246 RepID=UPI003564D55D